MNMTSTGKIKVGAPNSQARYINSDFICLECIRKNKGNVYHDLHHSRKAMPLGKGICDVCEDKKEQCYLLS